MSLEKDPSVWQWLLGSAASAVGGLFGYHKYLDGRFAKKADKDEVNRHREHIAKLYDKVSEGQKENSAMFSEVMKTIHGNHVELLRELGRKVDKD